MQTADFLDTCNIAFASIVDYELHEPSVAIGHFQMKRSSKGDRSQIRASTGLVLTWIDRANLLFATDFPIDS